MQSLTYLSVQSINEQKKWKSQIDAGVYKKKKNERMFYSCNFYVFFSSFPCVHCRKSSEEQHKEGWYRILEMAEAKGE